MDTFERNPNPMNFIPILTRYAPDSSSSLDLPPAYCVSVSSEATSIRVRSDSASSIASSSASASTSSLVSLNKMAKKQKRAYQAPCPFQAFEPAFLRTSYMPRKEVEARDFVFAPVTHEREPSFTDTLPFAGALKKMLKRSSSSSSSLSEQGREDDQVDESYRDSKSPAVRF